MTRPAARERPIIMSAPDVRAILDGRKTQTRRLARMTPRVWLQTGDGPLDPVMPPSRWQKVRPGDRLWVRETWARHMASEDRIYPEGDHHPWGSPIYRATFGAWLKPECEGFSPWRPSIHMPRWASRITLEVTGVRVERLQDISEDDARAEGMERMRSGRGFYDAKAGHGAVRLGVWHPTAQAAFLSLWQDLHSPASWADNPEVVVLSFARVEA